MAKKKSSETPLMKQYNAIKAKHPGALLLFRVGDFYETFGEDAVKASKILEIVLTKRANGSASHIELAGFPHHSLETYLPKLVRAGNRVAICDQLEDPKTVKGIVKRGVTELVTPGLSLNDNVLEQKRNNYLASIHYGKDETGIAFLDLSTGEFMVASGEIPYIEKLVQSFTPSEIIFCKKKKEQYEASFRDEYNIYCLEDWIYGYDYGYEKLTGQFRVKSLKGFGIENMPAAICAAGAILFYLEETEHKQTNHITAISRIEEDRYVWLDKFTIRNLELVNANQPDGVPLIEVLDHTLTPMGSRMLRKWMLLPLKSREAINNRLEVTEAFLDSEHTVLPEIQNHLRQTGDVERLISKVATGRINPRELLQLKKALHHTRPVKQLLISSENLQLKNLGDQLHNCDLLYDLISSHIKEDAPLLVHQGNIIQDGVHQELDELRKIAFSGKDYLLQIQQRETEATGITSLKIAYNKVFGYYLEVTNAHKDKVPEEWIRKQTLVNAERYITQELKVYEEKILNAEGQLQTIEQDLYQKVVNRAGEYLSQVQQNARILATLDCLSSFAEVAARLKYCRPVITEETALDIKEGRHPVIEVQMAMGDAYVPNDVYLDDQTQQIMVITGPNMAGKSALLRQTALITLMAQMGSFVPATYARVGIVDKVFTRVGASDNLSKGESTFMVEMTETASILNNLSGRSLVLMDEIGRGTSTYDGISIAWAIVEYLHNHPKYRAKTLFATHYHELNQLADDFPRVKNFNVSVKELDNRIVFMRKLKEGGSEHSFGIHVAQLAGMPNEVVLRSSEIMQHLEKDKVKEGNQQKIADMPKQNYQLSMFEADPKMEKVIKQLSEVDINSISPVEALLKLNNILKVLKG